MALYLQTVYLQSINLVLRCLTLERFLSQIAGFKGDISDTLIMIEVTADIYFFSKCSMPLLRILSRIAS